MIKILLMILLTSIILTANDDHIKDIKRLYPIAQKWVWFTTDFGNHYETKIEINKKVNPFIMSYQILDLKKNIVYEDFITIPVKVTTRRDYRRPIIIGIGSFVVGILSGIFITVQIEK